MTDHTTAAQGAMQATVLTPEERAAAIAHLTERDTFTTRDLAIERAVVSKLRAPVATDWRSMDTAPLDGREVLLQVELRAGMPGRCLVGHYMPGGHCIEDHPPIAQGWYFWDGREFDLASKPTGWLPLPPDDVYSALASAPVAGEAQLSEYRRGVMDAFHLANMANANRQGRTAEETCAHLVRSLADLANGDAAPQASEAVRNAEDAERWRWATASDGNADKLCSIVLCHGGYQEKINDRADFYRAALSAQPGAQKEKSDEA